MSAFKKTCPCTHHTSYFHPFFNFSDSPPSSGGGDQNSLPPFKKGVEGSVPNYECASFKKGVEGGGPNYESALEYQSPSKTPAPLSCQAPFKSTNCPSLPLFRKRPLSSMLVFHEPPSKSWIFQWTPEILYKAFHP